MLDNEGRDLKNSPSSHGWPWEQTAFPEEGASRACVKQGGISFKPRHAARGDKTQTHNLASKQTACLKLP